MPAWTGPILVAMLALPLTGCVAPESLAPTGTAAAGIGPFDMPRGARATPLADGVAFEWRDASLPFEARVVVPVGATLVTAEADVPATDKRLKVGLFHADSGRRRCQSPHVTAWELDAVGTASCSALAVLDPRPVAWVVRVTGPIAPAVVRVVARAVPIEGPAARLDLGALSMPTFELEPTSIERVASHDGTLLHVEVTRPATKARVPAVLVSSPYAHDKRTAGLRPQDDVVRDWGARGYAIVVADVRGFGESGGCVSLWGRPEQLDQRTLVEWIARQPWSDGNVAAYGQSYTGTTAIEAAVEAPEALKAVIAVAPVVSAYEDWHVGGVPNGESVGSLLLYQRDGAFAQMDTADPGTSIANAANGFCDATLVARANDPRAVYDAFYAERDFTRRAASVRAAVLHEQGFEDENVKASVVSEWFDALPGPKLALLGHWEHQHAARADTEVLQLAWLDAHLKGKDVGLGKLPSVIVAASRGGDREAAAWPPTDADVERLYPDWAASRLSTASRAGRATIALDPAGARATPVPTFIEFERTVEAPLHVVGAPALQARVRVDGADNAYLAAYLRDAAPDGSERLVTWGMLNLAHRDGHDRYVPLRAGEVVSARVPFLPTEWTVERGHSLALEIRGVPATYRALLFPPNRAGAATFEGGADGTFLEFRTLHSE